MKCGVRRGVSLCHSMWVCGKPWRSRIGGLALFGKLVRTKMRAPEVVVMCWEEKPGNRSDDILRVVFDDKCSSVGGVARLI